MMNYGGDDSAIEKSESSDALLLGDSSKTPSCCCHRCVKKGCGLYCCKSKGDTCLLLCVIGCILSLLVSFGLPYLLEYLLN